MTDAADDDEFYRALATLPSVYLHPVANARGVRSTWTSVMGPRLARKYARMPLFFGLAIQFYVWGFIGGVVLVVAGSFAIGNRAGIPIGVAAGLLAIFTGLVLYYVGLASRRGAVTELLAHLRTVNPRASRGELHEYLDYDPSRLRAIAQANPEVFPPRG
ncbi:hypothetical protein GCM10022288_24130 [Gryllotalpicola kribbensis]|jgi:hypothetical protein|uniref:Uncharacterized protein n=1 Tax=Gryllotalpicola kribbensis TaxID=993084 RepID=A0ABP8AWS8_9MICO